MIHAIKHEMDPDSNINYRRKIPPLFKFMFRFMLAVPQKRKREEMLLILSNTH